MTQIPQECSTLEMAIETECTLNSQTEQGNLNLTKHDGNLNDKIVNVEKNNQSEIDVIVGQSENFTELERYLSGILSGLQKQQESQKNEVLQLILQQHQNLQGDLVQNSPGIKFNTISSSSSSSTAWTFTQGLILGQLSVIIFIIAFIKFFVFTEAAPTQASSIPSKANVSIIKTKKNNDDIDISRLQTVPLSRIGTDHNNNNNNSNSNEFMTSKLNLNDLNYQNEINKALGADNSRLDFDSTLTSILEKTYYDVKTHTPESLDWFNVLVAQIISQGRLEALNDGNIYESLNKALNSPQVLQYFDSIKITEINIGDDYPIFSNCRVKNNEGRLEAKIDVDVSDTITLGVETNLLINQPKFMSASLPIKLSISVVRFSACLTVSLIATDEDDETDNENGNQNSNMGKNKSDQSINNNQNNSNEHIKNEESTKSTKGGHSIALMFSFSPDFRLEFEIKSLIGSRAKLENIPRISSILENVIRKWFIERCIEPRFQLIKLPSMWPRSKNTRQSVSPDQL
jgi:maintenance of morphology protein 1